MADKMYVCLPREIHNDARCLKLNTSFGDPTKFIESFIQTRWAKHDEKEDTTYLSLCIKKNKFKKRVKVQRKSRHTLTVKEKKLLKINDIKHEKHLTYEAFIPLQQLWLKYFQETIVSGLGNEKNDYSLAHNKLLKADFHGCIMSVTKSKSPFLIGMTGIILQETRNVFKMITKQDVVKVVPKMSSVFTFEVNGFTFTIYGNQFRVKPSERAVRKFKSKATIAL